MKARAPRTKQQTVSDPQARGGRTHAAVGDRGGSHRLPLLLPPPPLLDSPAAARARQDICRILFGSALSVQPTA